MLLSHFEVVGEDRSVFVRARSLAMKDFEDSAVAAAAEFAGCDYIVTRNAADFRGTPVPVLSPDECLMEIDQQQS